MQSRLAFRQSVALGAAAVWVAAWIALTWGGLLDDALIHLRFAEASRAAGFLTFDGVTSGYGPSSLLFVGLLVAVTEVREWIVMPQIVSTLFYVACLALAARGAIRRDAARAGWVALSLLLISPMGIRWMTNGMETSLATLLCLALGTQAAAAARAGAPRRLVLFFCLGALIVFARMELALVVGCTAVALLLLTGWRSARGLRMAAALGAGAALTIGAVYLAFHTIVPDAAIAKTFGRLDTLGGLRAVALTFISAGMFGTALPLLLAPASFAAWRAAETGEARAAVAIAALPALLVIAAVILRGQALQGVRYFVPFFVFGIAFGLGLLKGRPAPMIARPLLAAGLAAFAIGTIVEAPIALGVQRSSARLLRTMAAQDLSRLQGVTGVAFDVGFISYFSRAQICDLSGLVNGRAHALAPAEQRMRDCVAARPQFAFVTPAQAATLGRSLDLSGWTTCHRYPTRSAFQEVTFSLLLAPGAPPLSCSARPDEGMAPRPSGPA